MHTTRAIWLYVCMNRHVEHNCMRMAAEAQHALNDKAVLAYLLNMLAVICDRWISPDVQKSRSLQVLVSPQDPCVQTVSGDSDVE